MTLFIRLLILSFVFFSSCKQQDVYDLHAFTKDGVVQAVVEIPAGTNAKIEYNTNAHEFEVDQIDGCDRLINYLAYPGNYGFIPGTLADSLQGGDGDALDIIVLSSSIPSGTVIEVIPLGVFKLLDNNEEDYKIIAIPYKRDLQTINASSFSSLNAQYSGVLKIIELWFLNYNPTDSAKSLGWGDEKEALATIQANLVK